jgi:hypothetical protein
MPEAGSVDYNCYSSSINTNVPLATCWSPGVHSWAKAPSGNNQGIVSWLHQNMDVARPHFDTTLDFLRVSHISILDLTFHEGATGHSPFAPKKRFSCFCFWFRLPIPRSILNVVQHQLPHWRPSPLQHWLLDCTNFLVISQPSQSESGYKSAFPIRKWL